MSVVTRFAPSPTGYLHVGGVRTALFNWLYARRLGGKFILRIEDTDLERSTAESVEAILQGMAWVGLEYDEGPYYQTHRFDRYREVIAQLLAQGDAYRCYCSKERLDSLRAEQMASKEKPRYDGLCRHRENQDADAPHVIRFKNPHAGVVLIQDLVQGKITIQNSELDDLIIARTDGSPTYNLTVVVDDWDMGITHVIRGDDHLNNTPRQINILKALDAPLPRYGHVPMILGDDGARLSKRHGAVSVVQYREQGILPEALLNYLVRLGWSHGDQEIFSLEEMIKLFDIEAVNKSASAFNTEKLHWLNQHYIKAADPDRLATLLQPHMEKLGIDVASGAALSKVVVAQKERAKTLVEMAEISAFFYQEFADYDAKAASKNLKVESIEVLRVLAAAFEGVTDWRAEPLHQVVLDTAEALDIKLGKVAQPLRVAVCGRAASPPIDITLELLGKARTTARIARAIAYMESLETA